MTIINLQDREAAEQECNLLAHELLHRCEQGAASFPHVASLARRILALAEGETS